MSISRVVPGRSAAAVTPSDSVNLAVPSRALWIGTEGNISVEMVDEGKAVVFTAVVGLLQIQVTRVNSTNTTATNITAIW